MVGGSPDVNILYRPDAVAERKQFGHWECDLIQFRKKFGKANVTSLVERVSRFAIFLRNNDRQSRPVMDGLIQVLQSLPHLARRSITFDRGADFTDWPYLQASIGAQTWFCDPQSPWQKGTVENTNRRARKWLSREVDPLSLSDRDLTDICNHLNATPRKCLGYKTPAELMQLRFVRWESAFSYFEALALYLKDHGAPVAFYSDKHSVFGVAKKDAKGGQGMTQFGRVTRGLAGRYVETYAYADGR